MQRQRLFSVGRLVATPMVLASVSHEELLYAVARHASGDWGTVDDDDRRANDLALQHGDRLLSAYVTSRGTKFLIITEADHSTTTVLLPNGRSTEHVVRRG